MLFTWNDRLLDRDVYILWQFLKAFLYDYNLNRKWITLCCWLTIDNWGEPERAPTLASRILLSCLYYGTYVLPNLNTKF